MSIYRITTRFIPLGSTDRTIVAAVDENWCRTRLTEINAIFAPAQLTFVFGALDQPIFEDSLNLDVPPGNDPQGVETARQSLAETFPNELVVFIRNYLPKDNNDTRYKSFHYSSVQGDYVVAEPSSSDWGLAHEFGHFFGLPHTFDQSILNQIVAVSTVPERIKIVSDLLTNAIASGQVAQHEALTLLDGDRDVIGDTPPDIGPPIFQPTNTAGEESGPNSPSSITISVVVRKGDIATTPIPYALTPDKLNLMSYFSATERPHFSAQQAEAVHTIVYTGKRRRLITGRWTNWVPRDSGILNGSPSVICRRPGIVELFGHGTDDRTWQNTFVDGQWLAWFSHNDDFSIGATPMPGSMSPDHLQLFVIDPAGAVWNKWWFDSSGSWTAWEPLGNATLHSSPSVICRRPGIVELFGHGMDDRTWQNTFVNGQWLGWFSHNDDFPIGATPMCSSMSPDHLQLFVIDPAGAVWNKWWLDSSGSWTAWELLGNATLNDSPSVICRRPGIVELFGHGMDGRTWQNTFVNGQWLGWFSHNDDFPIGATSIPGSMSPDQVQLFVTDPTGAVWHKWWLD